MKRVLFPGLLLVVLALLLGIGAVACGDDDDDGDDGGAATSTGGDGSTTLGAYLKDVNDIQEGVTEATDAIGEQSETWADPPKARQSLSAAIDVADGAVAALKTLDPPDEASSEHAALIAAGENLVAVATDYSDQLQGMQSGPAFDTFAEEAQAADSELSQAINDMVSACNSMEAVSEEYKTGVDLACPKPIS